MKILLVLMISSIIGLVVLTKKLKDGSIMRYLDTHPHAERVPVIQYYIGDGYYLIGDLQNSATYYQRVYQQYPKSSYAGNAYFSYLKSLDDMETPRFEMMELYRTYIERYPDGEYVPLAKKRIEVYQTR